MKAHQFLSVVPKPVRIAACAIVCCAVLIGLVAGALHGRPVGHCNALPVLESLAGTGMGLFFGSLIAIWILCLGYVYADAQRRAMQPVLWTLVALLVPNLLGFLLYFALRRPVTVPCPKCGHAVAPEQRFCAWCGCEIASSPSSQTPPQAPVAPS
jgi:Phospholipase_D-nuclease N-terminal/zinc-ribbon domain